MVVVLVALKRLYEKSCLHDLSGTVIWRIQKKFLNLTGYPVPSSYPPLNPALNNLFWGFTKLLEMTVQYTCAIFYECCIMSLGLERERICFSFKRFDLGYVLQY